MATEKWVAGSGVGLTWTDCAGSVLNSIVTGNAIISTVNIDNSAALDVFMDVSIALGSITPTGSPFIGIYLYPLNQDGTTYGDGRFGSSAAGPPGASYFVGSINLVAAVGAQEGIVRGILIPPGQFKLVFHNVSGVTLAASANAGKYRTYNRSVA